MGRTGQVGQNRRVEKNSLLDLEALQDEELERIRANFETPAERARGELRARRSGGAKS